MNKSADSTNSNEERLEIIASRLPVQEWLHKQRLVITFVNVQTGEWVRFDRDGGVPLALAVSASCAVPSVYPPVTIGTSCYIDGGVRSGTNADIAAADLSRGSMGISRLFGVAMSSDEDA